uniref:Glycylpeptide N-tetradecanoyltransferase n=1 Tax=Panagrolaimus sp. ES5 TaxID=591445 RepID=A0AC34FRT4_9BILA
MSKEQNPPEENHAASTNHHREGLDLAVADVNAPLAGAADAGVPERDNKVINLLQQQLRQLNLQEQQPPSFQFWNTQPVPKLGEVVTENTYINPPVAVEQVQQTPYNLPKGFHWTEVDLQDTEELKELYTLLSLNYVEDDDNMFRFDYSAEFLLWALMPPGWQKVWHCGVRAGANNKLVGFIGAIPCHLQVHNKDVKCVEINFLCVHKKLRSKRLAPVLIKEITRRVNLKGIFQATFTAGVVIPKPIARCRYWHRTLNPKKLIETSFSALQPNMTMARTIKLFKVADNPLHNIIPLQEKHIKSAYKLLKSYLKNFKLYPLFTEAEFKHFMLPRDNIIYSYVLVDDKQHVTDLCSFYNLPSTVVNHPNHNQIKAAYSFYNVATTVPFKDLMQDALIMAKKASFDVFNALDIMENEAILKELKFGIGDGFLQYYLYNWKCPDLSPEQVGFVLQ